MGWHDALARRAEAPGRPSAVTEASVGSPRRLATAWSSIRSQVLLSLLVKRHTSNEYYRDNVIAEHQQLFDLLSTGQADECEKAIKEHISATYDRLMASFREAEG